MFIQIFSTGGGVIKQGFLLSKRRKMTNPLNSFESIKIFSWKTIVFKLVKEIFCVLCQSLNIHLSKRSIVLAIIHFLVSSESRLLKFLQSFVFDLKLQKFNNFDMIRSTRIPQSELGDLNSTFCLLHKYSHLASMTCIMLSFSMFFQLWEDLDCEAEIWEQVIFFGVDVLTSTSAYFATYKFHVHTISVAITVLKAVLLAISALYFLGKMDLYWLSNWIGPFLQVSDPLQQIVIPHMALFLHTSSFVYAVLVLYFIGSGTVIILMFVFWVSSESMAWAFGIASFLFTLQLFEFITFDFNHYREFQLAQARDLDEDVERHDNHATNPRWYNILTACTIGTHYSAVWTLVFGLTIFLFKDFYNTESKVEICLNIIRTFPVIISGFLIAGLLTWIMALNTEHEPNLVHLEYAHMVITWLGIFLMVVGYMSFYFFRDETFIFFVCRQCWFGVRSTKCSMYFAWRTDQEHGTLFLHIHHCRITDRYAGRHFGFTFPNENGVTFGRMLFLRIHFCCRPCVFIIFHWDNMVARFFPEA